MRTRKEKLITESVGGEISLNLTNGLFYLSRASRLSSLVKITTISFHSSFIYAVQRWMLALGECTGCIVSESLRE